MWEIEIREGIGYEVGGKVESVVNVAVRTRNEKRRKTSKRYKNQIFVPLYDKSTRSIVVVLKTSFILHYCKNW